MASITYKHVPDNEGGFDEDKAGAIELAGIPAPSAAASETPPGSEGPFVDDDDDVELKGARLRLFSVINSLLMVALVLAPWTVYVYHFTGRLWAAWIPALLAHLRLRSSRRILDAAAKASDGRGAERRSRASCCRSCAGIALDLGGCVVAAPLALHLLTEALYRDVDGTVNFDWRRQVFVLRVVVFLGIIVAVSRIGVAVASFSRHRRKKNESDSSPHPNQQRQGWSTNKSTWLCSDSNTGLTMSQSTQQRLHGMIRVLSAATLILNALCAISVWSHFGPFPEMSLVPDGRCNPVDPTMCALPFPSYYHMKRDNATATGWRVDLRGLPLLRGGIPLRPEFLNDLDGFSTMAPILFYMEGLKEAHEKEEGTTNGSSGRSRLQGPERIAHSVTNQSLTLLIDVDNRGLVPHSAEIDYLDPDRPLVMVIPARPLRHDANYAVAVVNACDVNGDRLPQSPALKEMMSTPWPDGDPHHLIFAALLQAAEWMDVGGDPESVQLLFGFTTISQECQIGRTRAVRDATLEYLDNWDWEEHAEVVSEQRQDCGAQGDALIARTYHINLDIPSFLESRSRYSTLDDASLDTGQPASIGKAKAMIRIPCSVERAALQDEGGIPAKAIMEYGHGLFHHRGEVRDSFLSRMANDNGYILMAMDWRGMSRFDMPVVIRTLIGNPNLFRAVRDNLIQGYSEKLALQHFARNGMLDWLRLDGVRIPTEKNEQPTSVFYGISQGGILGGGYLALAGKTNLIDRGVLGSPGTTFASVMTRSLDFLGYDILLLTNFRNNRHVRLLLTLIQMGWDSVETSGLLAPFVDETLSLPVLIQTGLGDAVVPTSACEAMVRAMNGSTLPNNPRSIYGIPVDDVESDPNVVLTELMYEREYESLPEDNTFPNENRVHWCVRNDPLLIDQIEQFTNTGQIIDPCVEDQCKRKKC